MRGEDIHELLTILKVCGSPPHARGRRQLRKSKWILPGITPACAGKTADRIAKHRNPGDHPRMRGEDKLKEFTGRRVQGSPPHARGRPAVEWKADSQVRITPACAGKTPSSPRQGRKCRDHPRMRGEDVMVFLLEVGRPGSPPHARGRRVHRHLRRRAHGITPACAGKTTCLPRIESTFADHPRMRGEDLRHGRQRAYVCGITPACAGKTRELQSLEPCTPDHPRMRGEDPCSTSVFTMTVGSPPHARGRLRLPYVKLKIDGITPACAGKTCRVCRSASAVMGSPPHARGRPSQAPRSPGPYRITPACAGKTKSPTCRQSATPDHPRMRGEDDIHVL